MRRRGGKLIEKEQENHLNAYQAIQLKEAELWNLVENHIIVEAKSSLLHRIIHKIKRILIKVSFLNVELINNLWTSFTIVFASSPDLIWNFIASTPRFVLGVYWLGGNALILFWVIIGPILFLWGLVRYTADWIKWKG